MAITTLDVSAMSMSVPQIPAQMAAGARTVSISSFVTVRPAMVESDVNLTLMSVSRIPANMEASVEMD